MSGNTLALIELLFVFGLLLAFGIREFRSLRKDEPEDTPNRADPSTGAKREPDGSGSG
ncbi:MAG: hypothetical protein ACFB6S_03275 [Geminicoccaceae bacterium]